MKILFISTKGPLPTNDGHCLRTFNLLQQVSLKHEIHLLSFVKYEEEYGHIDQLKEICASVKLLPLKENDSQLATFVTLLKSIFSDKPFVFHKYNKTHMSDAIKGVLEKENIDIVHFDMLPLYCYRELIGDIPVLLNQHNIESALLKRRVEAEPFWRKWFFAKQQYLLENYEVEAMRGVDAVAVCSGPDQVTARNMAPETPVDVIPNGVDTVFFENSGGNTEKPFSLIFVGGLNWYPNLEGLQWFDREVLPLLVKEFPDIRIQLVGRQIPVSWKHPDSFQVHGFVDDIRPYLEQASLFIVPLRVGGGTRLKILDAFSMGKAVLSTSIGAEGLGGVDGQHLVLADSADEFAKSVIALCTDSSRRQLLAENSRKFVLDNYRWEAIGERLCSLYSKICLNHSDE